MQSKLMLENWVFLIKTQFFLVLHLFLVSCSKENNCSVEHETIDYKVVDQIKIPLEGNQYAFSHTIINPFNDKLYGLDPSNLLLTAFDLTNEGSIETIGFEDQGPNGLYKSGFLSFNFIGKDSILFLNDFGEINIFNNAGKKLFESNVKHYDFQHMASDRIDFDLLNIGSPYFIHFPLKVDHSTNSLFAANV